MAWTKLHYAKNQVDNAGVIFARSPTEIIDGGWGVLSTDYFLALEVINNWRASHSFPLNTFTVGLKRACERVGASSLVAQRIKRLASISHKLERFSTMQLSQMQDIGGCRAIVSSVDEVLRIVENYKRSKIKHKLVRGNDYISKPKNSGYRGIHLIYRYFSDRSKDYNGLQIEMQLRSQYQHAWATAVETVGTFVQQALKSSLGEPDWLKFFALMGTAIALKEGGPPTPGTPDNIREVTSELRRYTEQLALADRLRSFGTAMETLGRPTEKGDTTFFCAWIGRRAR
jgi:hypothetical protein